MSTVARESLIARYGSMTPECVASPLLSMIEHVHAAESELRQPARFLADALTDLRRSPSIAWRLFLRNVQARYRRSVLSYVWLLLPSIGGTLVWVYMQSHRIVGIEPTPVPYAVYVFSGTILWQVFVDALNAPIQQLTAGRQMITRSRVPLEALILAGLMEVALNTVVRLIVLAGMLAAFDIAVGPPALLAVFGITALALFGLTLGMLAAPMGLLYDDVQRAILMATGFWFFLTPIVYPVSNGGILRFNPVTPLLETTRSWLTAGNASGGFVIMTLLTLFALVLAWLLQRLARPHVVARLG